MDYGRYTPYVVPPIGKGAKELEKRKLLQEIQLEEYKTLVFLYRFHDSIGKIIEWVSQQVQQIDEKLFAKVQKLSAKQICYMWDWIALLNEGKAQQGNQEKILFSFQLYHLCDNLKQLKSNYIHLTNAQIVALRYLPLQAQTWTIRARDFDFRIWVEGKIFDSTLSKYPLAPQDKQVIGLLRKKQLRYAFRKGKSNARLPTPNLFLAYPIWNIGKLCLFLMYNK